MTNRNRQDIDVVLTLVSPDMQWPDGIKFELVSKIAWKNKLTFKNKGKPGFDLRFNIVDDDNTGYRFPDDEAAAMWVCPVEHDTDPCPKSVAHWPTFFATDVTGGNKTLKVTNLNDEAQLLKFTLLFTETPEQNGPCIEFDPIVDNRNGPQSEAKSALAIAIGALALVFGVFAFFRARKE